VFISTKYFGDLEVSEKEILRIPSGILGFSDHQDFCLLDSGEDTFILWLQSLKQASVAFPLLEPKLFKPDYTVKLSSSESRELQLENVNAALIFSILTIPEAIESMSANLKAPLLIHAKKRLGKQVVLPDSDCSIAYPMFQQLRLHTVRSGSKETQSVSSVLPLENLPAFLTFDAQL
jgi:flagellar assembly factor FliW